MIADLLLYFTFAMLGLIIGMNWQPSVKEPIDDKELPREIKKLQHELTVQKNVNDSLLEDVRYWRSRVKNDNHPT